MTTPTKARVLLVDDNELVLRALQRVLSKTCDVLVATSVEKALAIVAREPVDVVISDYAMNGDDGLALLQALRDELPSVRRILHTGAPPANIKEHLDSGLLDDLIMKPADNNVIRGLFSTAA